MRYRQVQTSPKMYLIAVAGAVGLLVGLALRDDAVGFVIFEAVMLLLIVTGMIASRLTVTIDERDVTTSFGWGWPRRRIALIEIVGVAGVHNSWWYGWGLRKVPRGWMFNNAGREAVELELASGRVFRIGTEDPTALVAALEVARRSG